MEKHCKKCDRMLETENFSKDSKSKDGHQRYCRNCNKKYREENRERILFVLREYYYKNREELLDKKKDYHVLNRSQRLEYSKVRYYGKREEIITKNSEYARNNRNVNNDAKKKYAKTTNGQILRNIKNHKRRYVLNNLPFNYSIREWKECKEHFSNICAYCGDDKKLTKDHFVALTKGGEFTRDNIIPICRRCNSSKGDKDFFEWYPKQAFYNLKSEKKILDFLKYKNRIQQLGLPI